MRWLLFIFVRVIVRPRLSSMMMMMMNARQEGLSHPPALTINQLNCCAVLNSVLVVHTLEKSSPHRSGVMIILLPIDIKATILGWHHGHPLARLAIATRLQLDATLVHKGEYRLAVSALSLHDADMCGELLTTPKQQLVRDAVFDTPRLLGVLFFRLEKVDALNFALVEKLKYFHFCKY